MNNNHHSNHHFLVLLSSIVAILFSLLSATPISAAPNIQENGVINAIYFYSYDCSHCQAVKNELLAEMEIEYGESLNILYIEISTAANYELLIEFEEFFEVSSTKRAIPTLIINNMIMIGEEEIYTLFPQIVSDNLENGIGWPLMPGFNAEKYVSDPFTSGGGFLDEDALCDIEDEICEVENPIFMAYFYQTGCKVCSRVEADINYIQTKFPQIIVEEFNIFDNVGLGQWLMSQAKRSDDIATPALFIGNTMLIGEEEITPAAIEALVVANESGADAIWNEYNENTNTDKGLFDNLSWITIAFAGLIDGLNPCAFATLIFFVSYLSLSQRKGKEILMVGGAFALGVFIAYLVVGLGFYQVLDLLGGIVANIINIVYGITRHILPWFWHSLASKTRSKSIKVVRQIWVCICPINCENASTPALRAGCKASAYVWFAFVTGLIISMLELACTGQIYLPTIIFMTSQDSMQIQAIMYLLLYNFMFIVPLIVVFILAFYGTNSSDLTKFLEKHATKIKVGMGILFSALGFWLIYSIFK